MQYTGPFTPTSSADQPDPSHVATWLAEAAPALLKSPPATSTGACGPLPSGSHIFNQRISPSMLELAFAGCHPGVHCAWATLKKDRASVTPTKAHTGDPAARVRGMATTPVSRKGGGKTRWGCPRRVRR